MKDIMRKIELTLIDTKQELAKEWQKEFMHILCEGERNEIRFENDHNTCQKSLCYMHIIYYIVYNIYLFAPLRIIIRRPS